MGQPTSLYIKDRSVPSLGFTEKRLSKDLVKEGQLKYVGLGAKCTKLKPQK